MIMRRPWGTYDHRMGEHPRVGVRAQAARGIRHACGNRHGASGMGHHACLWHQPALMQLCSPSAMPLQEGHRVVPWGRVRM